MVQFYGTFDDPPSLESLHSNKKSLLIRDRPCVITLLRFKESIDTFK